MPTAPAVSSRRWVRRRWGGRSRRRPPPVRRRQCAVPYRRGGEPRRRHSGVWRLPSVGVRSDRRIRCGARGRRGRRAQLPPRAIRWSDPVRSGHPRTAPLPELARWFGTAVLHVRPRQGVGAQEAPSGAFRTNACASRARRRSRCVRRVVSVAPSSDRRGPADLPYLAVIGLGTWRGGRSSGASRARISAAALVTVHLSYGIGLFVGAAKRPQAT